MKIPNQHRHFLNNELKKKAQARGMTVLPALATVNMSEVAKVKLKNVPNTPTN